MLDMMMVAVSIRECDENQNFEYQQDGRSASVDNLENGCCGDYSACFGMYRRLCGITDGSPATGLKR